MSGERGAGTVAPPGHGGPAGTRPGVEEQGRGDPGPDGARRHAGGGARRVFLIVTAVVVLGILAFLAQQMVWGGSHVSDDNAQVEGHVIPVLSRVSGYVDRVDVDENQRVRDGQELAHVDERDLRAKLAQAEADLAAAEAVSGQRGRTGQASAQLQAARAAAEQARVNAQNAVADRDRYRSLAQGNIISRQTLDAAETRAAAAQAQLNAAMEQVAAASAGVRGAEGRVEAARAARDQAALNLSYARILSPDSGTVSHKTVEVGQYVQAGQPLMSVVPLHDVWVTANLKETSVRNVLPGDAVEITVDSYPGKKFPGRVESLSPATGARFSLLPPDNATGNYTKVVQRIPVRIRLEKPNDPVRPLRPGMSVRVTITTTRG